MDTSEQRWATILTLLKNHANEASANVSEIQKTLAQYQLGNNDMLDIVLNNLRQITTQLENLHFTVSIVALTKAGKSTLLNTFLRQEILPSATQPETAGLVRIRHRHGDCELMIDNISVATGVVQCREKLLEINRKTRTNDMRCEQDILLYAPFECLSKNDISFELRDSPGVNESSKHLQKESLRMIRQSDVILYVLNFVNLKTESEEKLFKLLKEEKGNLLSDLDRCYFVVNCIDQAKDYDENSLNAKTVSAYICSNVKKWTGVDIPPTKVIPCSAALALYSFLLQNQPGCTEENENHRKEFCFFTYGHLKMDKYVKNWDFIQNDIPENIEFSRIHDVEAEIINSIYNSRSVILIKTVLDKLITAQSTLFNSLQPIIAAASEQVGELTERKLSMERKLLELQTAFATQKQFVLEEKRRFSEIVSTDFDTLVNGNMIPPLQNLFRGKPIGEPKLSLAWKTALNNPSNDTVMEFNKHMKYWIQHQFEIIRIDIETDCLGCQHQLIDSLNSFLATHMEDAENAANECFKTEVLPIGIKLDPLSSDQLHSAVANQSFVTVHQKTEQHKEGYGGKDRKGNWKRWRNKITSVYTNSLDIRSVEQFWMKTITDVKTVAKTKAQQLVENAVDGFIQKCTETFNHYCQGFLNSGNQALQLLNMQSYDREQCLNELITVKTRLETALTHEEEIRSICYSIPSVQVPENSQHQIPSKVPVIPPNLETHIPQASDAPQPSSADPASNIDSQIPQASAAPPAPPAPRPSSSNLAPTSLLESLKRKRKEIQEKTHEPSPPVPPQPESSSNIFEAIQNAIMQRREAWEE